jgi:hypothetical protein
MKAGRKRGRRCSWLTVFGYTPLFCGCVAGKGVISPLFLYVWQGKELSAQNSYVWQAQNLRARRDPSSLRSSGLASLSDARLSAQNSYVWQALDLAVWGGRLSLRPPPKVREQVRCKEEALRLRSGREERADWLRRGESGLRRTNMGNGSRK